MSSRQDETRDLVLAVLQASVLAEDDRHLLDAVKQALLRLEHQTIDENMNLKELIKLLNQRTRENKRYIRRIQAIRAQLAPGTLTNDDPIAMLGLPNKLYHALELNRITTIGQLTSMTVEDVLAQREIGPASMQRIADVLHEHGFHLAEQAQPYDEE